MKFLKRRPAGNLNSGPKTFKIAGKTGTHKKLPKITSKRCKRNGQSLEIRMRSIKNFWALCEAIQLPVMGN